MRAFLVALVLMVGEPSHLKIGDLVKYADGRDGTYMVVLRFEGGNETVYVRQIPPINEGWATADELVKVK